jgi:hypothetical protein
MSAAAPHIQQRLDEGLLRDALAASGASREFSFSCVPEHSFKKVPGKSGCQAPVGERVCRRARHAPIHNLPTMNDTVARDPMVYQSAKRAWSPYLVGKLLECGLAKGLSSILVEGTYIAPTNTRRDQGNHRSFIEKVLGDVLCTPYCPRCRHPRLSQDKSVATCDNPKCTAGPLVDAWVPDDSWNFYEFGNFHYRVEPGVRCVEIRLLPDALTL